MSDRNGHGRISEGGYPEAATGTATTPSKLKSILMENLQNKHQVNIDKSTVKNTIVNNKKRAPTTPLTPTLIQKNIVKRQVLLSRQLQNQKEYSEKKFDETQSSNRLEDENDQQLNEKSHMAIHGSPSSKKVTPLQIRSLDELNSEYQQTPKITKGIKLAVRENKKNRLNMVKAMETHDNNASDSEYSEVSTLAGDTPINYKYEHENLTYYKNGYYINSEDITVYELQKENIIKDKELKRVNDLLEFMQLERQFENENDNIRLSS